MLLLAAAGIAVGVGLLLLASAIVTAGRWLPFLSGQRVTGRVVASQGRHFLRYSYPFRKTMHTGELGLWRPEDASQPPAEWEPGAFLELLIARDDPARSLPLSQIEPLEIMPLLGLGLLFLAYGGGGLLVAWRTLRDASDTSRPFDHISRLLAATKLPVGVLICSLLSLAILSWCAPLAARWIVAATTMAIEAGLLGCLLTQAVRGCLPAATEREIGREDIADPRPATLPFPTSPRTALRRAA